MGINGQFDVLRPSADTGRRAYVDFAFGLNYLSLNSGLLRLMHEAMSAYGLSCLLINNSSVNGAIEAVRKGSLRPLVYLDLCSNPGNPFLALLQAMSEAGLHTLCDPRALKWTYKAVSHPALQEAGLPLPPSLILKKDDPDRDLTSEELARLGDRCVIKPSFGVAGLGAVIGVAPTRQQIAAARDFNRQDDWLIQKMMSWTKFGERQAYIRAYNVLGYRTLMWWNNETGYSSLTWDDLQRHDLLPTVEMIDRIAAVTGVEFFSTEIAISADAGEARTQSRFCLIDYVNDQCDIDPHAHPGRSPPETWVRWICHRMAEFTWRKKRDLPASGEGTLYLADAG
jgi:hypothetical protein